MVGSLTRPLRLRWVLPLSICLCAAVLLVCFRALVNDHNGRGISAERNLGALVVEEKNSVSVAVHEEVSVNPEVISTVEDAAYAGGESLGNSSLKRFYEAKLEEGLVHWKQKKLWFYQTLLAQRNHSHFQCYVSRKHQFKVCTSPKVSSSVWKAVFCELNRRRPSRCYPGTADWYESGLSRMSTWVDESKATIVRIVRDPLERLVSAYFDKCVHETHRRSQKHCHPKEIMVNQPRGYFLKPETFAEWVDLLGHDWDEHVMPQCAEAYFPNDAVPYTPQPYTHIIEMGDDYVNELEAMLESAKLISAEDKRAILRKFNASLAGRADRKTLQTRYRYYFSRSSVARALQYYAMDYKCLKLPLPSWLLNVTH